MLASCMLIHLILISVGSLVAQDGSETEEKSIFIDLKAERK
jgi:hypothetical protein